ncbi:MAG: AAA family ATPase [Myxococcota bacterium]
MAEPPATQPSAEPLPDGLLEALRRPTAYPHDPDAAQGVECVQTHLSVVFLTRSRVYKIQKAVDLGFVSLLARARRSALCLREVELNRRLAPAVYLGVAPIRAIAGGFEVGEPAEGLATTDGSGGRPEHCVVMRRLASGRDALSLLRVGALGETEIDRVAERVARFHAQTGLGRPAPFSGEDWWARIEQPVQENFRVLEGKAAAGVSAGTLRIVAERAAQFSLRHRRRFESRRCAGRAVDGHGDLHLQHVWLEPEAREPIVIDCIAFRDDFRQIDSAADIAFLAMDLAYRGAVRLAERLLACYARESDDYDLYGVVDYFASYRAAVRAKVAALAAEDASLGPEQRTSARESIRRHLKLAAELLREPAAAPLVALCGMIGAGKSTVAHEVADVLGAVVLSSDARRKRLTGIASKPRERAGWGEGIYSEKCRERVYRELLECATPVLGSGRAAVIDASFARVEWRAMLRRWADERAVRVYLIEVRCGQTRTLERLAHRAQAGHDASEAGPEHLAQSRRSFQPPQEWPQADRTLVETDGAGWRESLRHWLRVRVSASGDDRPQAPA